MNDDRSMIVMAIGLALGLVIAGGVAALLYMNIYQHRSLNDTRAEVVEAYDGWMSGSQTLQLEINNLKANVAGLEQRIDLLQLEVETLNQSDDNYGDLAELMGFIGMLGFLTGESWDPYEVEDTIEFE